MQGIYWRSYWTIPTIAAGALVEVIGVSSRVSQLIAVGWPYLVTEEYCLGHQFWRPVVLKLQWFPHAVSELGLLELKL